MELENSATEVQKVYQPAEKPTLASQVEFKRCLRMRENSDTKLDKRNRDSSYCKHYY